MGSIAKVIELSNVMQPQNQSEDYWNWSTMRVYNRLSKH